MDNDQNRGNGPNSWIVLCGILCFAVTVWFGISMVKSEDHCHHIIPNDLTTIKMYRVKHMKDALVWTLNKIRPINANLRHHAIEPPLTIALTRFEHKLEITGPIKDALGNEYYDVSYPNEWFDYSSMIVKHWQSTLPHGIKSVYDYRRPEIFFHARRSNPYGQFDRRGYWTDDNQNELWTVALTNRMYAIKWIYAESSTALVGGIGYVVVFKFKHKNHDKCKIKLMDWQDDRWTSSTNYIKARYNFYHPNTICEASKYPDAYVFSETAQEGYCPLDIARVYRIHFHH